MANIIILGSSAVLAALSIPFGTRLAQKRKPIKASVNNAVAVAPEPRLLNPVPGWTLIECEDAAAFKAWLEKDEKGLPPLDGEELSLGSHVLVEMYGCDQETLEATKTVGCAMLDAAVASKATVVTDSFHEFQPYGVSGAVIIQESHYTIHTWPEHGYAAVDLFYCGGAIDVHRAVDILTERFKPSRFKFLVVRRGLISEVVSR